VPVVLRVCEQIMLSLREKLSLHAHKDYRGKYCHYITGDVRELCVLMLYNKEVLRSCTSRIFKVGLSMKR
jgi:hypothetical protein